MVFPCCLRAQEDPSKNGSVEQPDYPHKKGNALAAAALLPVSGGVFCQVVLGRREKPSEEQQTP